MAEITISNIDTFWRPCLQMLAAGVLYGLTQDQTRMSLLDLDLLLSDHLLDLNSQKNVRYLLELTKVPSMRWILSIISTTKYLISYRNKKGGWYLPVPIRNVLIHSNRGVNRCVQPWFIACATVCNSCNLEQALHNFVGYHIYTSVETICNLCATSVQSRATFLLTPR